MSHSPYVCGDGDITDAYKRIEALEKVTAGQVAANKSEIAYLKNRLNRNNIN